MKKTVHMMQNRSASKVAVQAASLSPAVKWWIQSAIMNSPAVVWPLVVTDLPMWFSLPLAAVAVLVSPVINLVVMLFIFGFRLEEIAAWSAWKMTGKESNTYKELKKSGRIK